MYVFQRFKAELLLQKLENICFFIYLYSKKENTFVTTNEDLSMDFVEH